VTKKVGGAEKKSGQQSSLVPILPFGIALVILGLAWFVLAQSYIEVYPWSAEVRYWEIVSGAVVIMTVLAIVVSRSGRKRSDIPDVKKSTLPIGLTFVSFGFIILGVTAILVSLTEIPAWAIESGYFSLIIYLEFVALILAGSGTYWTYSRASTREFAVPENIMESLQRIEPDKSFETKQFFGFKKDGIYILLKKKFAGAHFVRLFKETPSHDKEARLPFLRSWSTTRHSSKFEINDLDARKVTGEFTIPVDSVRRGDRMEDKYVNGRGITYYVPVYPVVQAGISLRGGRYSILDLSAMLDESAILSIMEKLSKEKLAA
jgi:hypothetical protein